MIFKRWKSFQQVQSTANTTPNTPNSPKITPLLTTAALPVKIGGEGTTVEGTGALVPDGILGTRVVFE